MKSYRADAARREMRDILTAVEHGEHVQIQRYNTPTAIVVPPQWHEQAEAVIAAVRHGVIPVAPSQELDPWRMQPGDCQRALAAIWEALHPETTPEEH